MLSHINKRVKDQKHIKLPLQDLLSLYRNPESIMMVRNFTIVYIEMAFERSPRDEQLAVVPGLLEGIADRPGQHQDIFFRMVAKVRPKQGVNRRVRLTCLGRSLLEYEGAQNMQTRFLLVEATGWKVRSKFVRGRGTKQASVNLEDTVSIIPKDFGSLGSRAA